MSVPSKEPASNVGCGCALLLYTGIGLIAIGLVVAAATGIVDMVGWLS